MADYGLAQQTPAVWREQLENIAASQARASHLVDQLLALALADESRTGLQREPLRLDELIQQAVLRHLGRADAKGVDLGAQGLDEAVTVVANVALVEGTLDNLIDNALRYGGRTITIELVGCTMSVVDDGPGIPPETQNDLVQRWAQGPAGQKLGQGAGLGLAIVARYARLLGAELTFAKGVGRRRPARKRGLRCILSAWPAHLHSQSQKPRGTGFAGPLGLPPAGGWRPHEVGKPGGEFKVLGSRYNRPRRRHRTCSCPTHSAARLRADGEPGRGWR